MPPAEFSTVPLRVTRSGHFATEPASGSGRGHPLPPRHSRKPELFFAENPIMKNRLVQSC